MKLTKTDKALLNNWGYSEKDFAQIEAAAKKTTYTEENGGRISQKVAIKHLGKSQYLGGLARSAFHWSAIRETDDGQKIFFDSSRLFLDDWQ